MTAAKQTVHARHRAASIPRITALPACAPLSDHIAEVPGAEDATDTSATESSSGR